MEIEIGLNLSIILIIGMGIIMCILNKLPDLIERAGDKTEKIVKAWRENKNN